MHEIIIATKNNNKVAEMSKIIDLEGYRFIPMVEKGIDHDIVEDGSTLEENALIKARYLHKLIGGDVISEDTGLEIFALDMEPGVITARYAGPQRSATDNMNLCLQKLSNKKDRRAQFRTVICLIMEQKEYLFEGKVTGNLAYKIQGNLGFGYDPIFIPSGYDKTFGELPANIKNKISHRKNALDALQHFLKNNISK